MCARGVEVFGRRNGVREDARQIESGYCRPHNAVSPYRDNAAIVKSESEIFSERFNRNNSRARQAHLPLPARPL